MPHADRSVLGIVLLLSAVAACSTQQVFEGIDEGISTAAQWPDFTDADEARMARANARAFEDSVEMWDDPLLQSYLTEMTQRIVAVADPRPFDYRIRVVASPAINAFTFGGGFVYVNAGLVARMENEAQLAMVLGHEIAHVTERHVPEGIEDTYGLQLLGQVAARSAEATGTLEGPALETTYEYALAAAVNGHGRAREAEADRVGLRYMADAGYDPREGPRAFRVLFEEYGDPNPVRQFFWGTHPTSRSRFETMSEVVRTAYADRVSDPDLVVSSDKFQRSSRRLIVAVGVADYEAKRFNTARAMFRKAAPLSDSDPRPHYYLGRIALEIEGPAAVGRAIDHLRRATEADPEFAPARLQLGLAYYRADDEARAVDAFQTCIELAPGSREAARARQIIAELGGG